MRARAVLTVAVVVAGPLAGQYRGPRGADYLFVASAADARALWVNPAGLVARLEASVTGELVADRSRTGDLAFAQGTAGFNSRGIAFAYRRDRYPDSLTGHTWRLGAGRALTNLAVGATLTLHSNGDGPTQRGVDLGIRYRPHPTIELGALVGEIGKPIVHDSILNLTATGGLGWSPVAGVRLDAEGTISRATGSGSVRRWRAGAALATGGVRFPVAFAAIVDLDQELALRRLTLGLSIGGPDHGVVVISGARPGGDLSVDAVSLAGVVSRIPR